MDTQRTMEFLGLIWERLGLIFGTPLRAFERGITKLFGSSNERYVRNVSSTFVGAINELEPRYQAMSDAELREQTFKFRQRLKAGESLDDLLVEAFAVCREGGRRYLGMRHYDVQLIGGVVLHRGLISEMVTGEGKTLVATLPAYLNALEGKGVHVVTVNDYLARRDMEWMGRLYIRLGLTVGAIQSDMQGPEGTRARQRAYACDITYGTNNEFGFDYLRDNMRPAARGDDRFPSRAQQSQGRLNYAIIDEVDNILIDEARTPLIISGPAYEDVQQYSEADRIARALRKDKHFVVSEKDHNVHLTDEGVREAEKLAKVESFYTPGNDKWPRLIDNALKAHYLYQKDVRYVVKDKKRVVIVDEFTGRLMEGRQWSDGLHQAVEAKEGVKIKEETQTLATITLQNFFKLYKKMCGMTGTAMTEAGEFWKIYGMDVIAIPTNRELRREVFPDVIYIEEESKYVALADEVERVNRWDTLVMTDGSTQQGLIKREDEDSIEFQLKEAKEKKDISRAEISSIQLKGRPILIGTVSIEKSEKLSTLLKKRGVEHQVLNAKHHKREAEIISQAGRLSAVTIATNMAGRGTDIVLGGNPETMAWARLQDKYATRLDVPREEWDEEVAKIAKEQKMEKQGEYVKSIGGLYVMATERHEARRIDLQLRGRCGRQGDPGSSRFYLSLEDDLMRIFAGEFVKNMMGRLGMQGDDAIESRLVTRRIEAAQKKVEERHFEGRKSLLEYDEVMDLQRKKVYGYRQKILDGGNCRELVLDAIRAELDCHVDGYFSEDYGTECFVPHAATKLGGEELSRALDLRDFRGEDFHQAVAHIREEAIHIAEMQILDAVDENLPDVDDEEGKSEWNWQALVKLANRRWGLGLKDRNLKPKRERRDAPLEPSEERDYALKTLLDMSRDFVTKRDLDDAKRFFEPNFGLKEALEWAWELFGIVVKIDDEVDESDVDPIKFNEWVMSHFWIDLEIDEKSDLHESRQRRGEGEERNVAGLTSHEFKALIHRRILEKYLEKDVEFSVQGIMPDRDVKNASPPQNNEELAELASKRFGMDFAADQFKNKSSREKRSILIEHGRRDQQNGIEVWGQVKDRLDGLFPDEESGQDGELTIHRSEAEESLVDWLNEQLGSSIAVEEIQGTDRGEVTRRLREAVENRFRPEMCRRERRDLLDTIDSVWKGHLLDMDHLRSSVGLVGYAQVDPKVEYKREGRRIFDEMWKTVERKAAKAVLHAKYSNEDYEEKTWVETSATHAQAETASEMAKRQAVIDAGGGEAPGKTIRNRGEKVRKNGPCPCGSGRKFKKCCMRTKGAA